MKSLTIKNDYFRLSILPFLLLTIFLILLSFHIFRNIDFAITGDKYQAFNFANDIANGRFYQDVPLIYLFPDILPQDDEVPTGHLGTLYYKGRIFAKMEIGFPLILSGFYILFGMKSFFYVCQIFLICLLIVYYFVIAELFNSHRLRSHIALISTITVGVLPNSIIFVAGNQFRDIPALFFLFLSLLFFLKSMRSNEKVSLFYLYLSSFIFGISCTIRLTNIIFALPICVHFFLNAGRNYSFKKIFTVLFIAFSLFNLGMLPLYVQNIKTTGKIYLPPQHSEGITLFNIKGEEPADPIFANHASLRYFIPKLPKIYEFFKEVYSIAGLLLITAGIISSLVLCRKYLILIISSIFAIFFFGTYGEYFWSRYMLFSHPFIAPLLAFGIIRTTDTIRFLLKRVASDSPFTKADILIATFQFLLIISIVIVPDIGTPYFARVYNIDTEFFHYEDISHFKSAFGKYVPPNAILLASYRLYENINFYTDIKSTDIYQPLLWNGADFKFGFDRIFEKGIPLYFFANKGYFDGTKWITHIKEHFNLVPVAEISADEARLRQKYFFGMKKCILYKIENWKDREITLRIETPPNYDYLLTVNARQVWGEGSPKDVKVFINDNLISNKLLNGINYFKLPNEFIKSDISEFKISADVPLPKDVFVRIEPVKPYCILKSEANKKYANSIYPGGGFTFKNTQYLKLLDIDKPGKIRIPTIPYEDSIIRIKPYLRMRDKHFDHPDSLKLIFSLNDFQFATEEIVKQEEFQNLSAFIPEELVTSETSVFGIQVLDTVRDWHYFFDPSIELSSVRLEQWKRHINEEIASVKEKPYFGIIVFEVANIPHSYSLGQTVLIKINDEEFNANIREGINWIPVPDSIVQKFPTDFRILSSGSDGEILFRFINYLPIDNKYVLDIFSEESPFVKRGLYETEMTTDGYFIRWTDGNAGFSLPYKGDRRSIKVTISVDPLPGKLDNLETEVYVNGKRAGNFTALSKGSKNISFLIPKEILRTGSNDLEVRTPSWKPSEILGTLDGRKLGIPLRSIMVEYLDLNNEIIR